MTAARQGTVYLVGAGPGDPELLTVKAARLLASADVVLHDDLVPAAVLGEARGALIINVGKRCGRKNISQEQINGMMVEYARRGMAVIRLKSGDPLIFGRAGEEMDALRAAGVAFEVVPGITAAFAAAAALGRALTDRRSASKIEFSAGQHAHGSRDEAQRSVAATRVIYMPGRDLGRLAEQLRGEGLSGDLPCVLVSRAGQPEQQVVETALENLERTGALPAPMILLVGEALRDGQVDTPGEVVTVADENAVPMQA